MRHPRWGLEVVPHITNPKNLSPEEVGGGRSVMTNFQLLMLSPNLLKSQRTIMVEGGVGDGQFSKVNFKFSKSVLS